MCRGLRHDLKHVSVLDNLAVLVEAEDVDPSPVVVARPVLEAVQDHVGILGDHAPDLDSLTGVLLGHTGEVFNEALLAIGYVAPA